MIVRQSNKNWKKQIVSDKMRLYCERPKSKKPASAGPFFDSKQPYLLGRFNRLKDVRLGGISTFPARELDPLARLKRLILLKEVLDLSQQ